MEEKNPIIGEKALSFRLESTNGEKTSLEGFKGEKNVIIFFYPKDNTPGWITEASEFRDHYKEIIKHNFEVLGISKDSIKSHNKFKEKLNLPFELLSDPNREIHKSYNVLKPKKMFGKEVIGTVRSTFIIDKEGILIKEFRNVKAKGHGEEVLEYIKSM